MASPSTFPSIVQVVLDSVDVRGLAEFYRQLLGFEYRPGDEPPPASQPDTRGHDWLVIRHPSGSPRVAFQSPKRCIGRPGPNLPCRSSCTST